MTSAVSLDAPSEPHLAAAEPADRKLDLSVPGIHCAGCIARIEAGLRDVPGVTEARVNLSLKRVAVTHSGADQITDHLLQRLEKLGFEASPLDARTLELRKGTDNKGLLLRLGVAGFAAMNVMLLSVSVWSGADGATRDFLHWVSAAIALPALVFAAQPFFASAWTALRVWRLNMDVPISLAIFLASATSLYETAMSGPHAYFDAALSLTFFLLLGRYLDHLTRAKARSAAVELAALDVPMAHVRTAQGIETRHVSDLSEGDIVFVKTGARIPVDGQVVEGASELDNALLTGETCPVPVSRGATVYSGTLNLSGPLEIAVTSTGSDTLLGRIGALVQAAENTRTRYTSLAERAAGFYAPAVHLLALAAFAGWQIATGDTRLAINIATAVLIITCPCALGLAVPAVMTAANGRLFRAGVLVKDGTALERLAEIDTVILDKTGTLTQGNLRLASAPSQSDLSLAAALAQGSAHPLARSIAKRAQDTGVRPARVQDITEIPGKGIQGMFNANRVRLGHANWCGVTSELTGVQSWLAQDGHPPVAFQFEDQLKPGAAEMVKELKSLDLKVILLSGDSQAVTDKVASQLDIETALGNVAADQKYNFVIGCAGKALMVGDGLNDTAALTAAHVSAAPGKAIDTARTAADLVLLRDDLMILPASIRLARASRHRILENFAIAAAYNAIAIPAALAGFATPLLAALAMSASSITVSLNAMRLRGLR